MAASPSSEPCGGDEAAAWQWGRDQVEVAGELAVRVIADYLDGLAAGPVHRPVPESLKAAWALEPAPLAGSPAADVLGRFVAEIAPHPLGNGHPGFHAWVNSPPAVIGVLAEALAASMNPSVAGGDHAAVYIERQVVRWFAELAGLPSGAGGLLVSGASMATLTALAVARHQAASAAGVDIRASGWQSGGPRMVLYASAEAHGCVRKAAELLGIGSDNIREIEVDGEFRLQPRHLGRLLAAGRRSGELPVAVITSAGTVNTGAIDPIRQVSEVCAEHGVWLHVDAAYGGPAVLLLPEYVEVRDSLRLADSIAVDPHKWLYVPVGAGMLLLREPALAREAFSLVPPYLRAGDGAADEPWLSEFGFEQTRPFRALKVWMALQHLGLDGYRDLIGKDLRSAEYLRSSIRAAPDLELLAGELSIACFRYRPPGWSGTGEQLDELNRRVVTAVQQAGHAFVAGTTVHGRAAIRACVVNPGTMPSDLDVLLGEVRSHGARLTG